MAGLIISIVGCFRAFNGAHIRLNVTTEGHVPKFPGGKRCRDRSPEPLHEPKIERDPVFWIESRMFRQTRQETTGEEPDDRKP
jgi:hypothetical protein